MHDDTQIRLAVSLALLAWGIHFFYTKKYIYFIVISLLSVSFHYQSIIVFIALPFVSYLSSSKVNAILLIKTTLAIIMMYVAITNIGAIIKFTSQHITSVQSYADSEDKPNIFNVMIILNALLSLWGTKIFSQEKESIEKKFWLLGVFGVVSYYLFSQIGNIAFRISEAFLFFNCFWIGLSLKNKDYYVHRYLGYTIVLLLFLLNIYNVTNSVKPFYFTEPLSLYENNIHNYCQLERWSSTT